jgi:creatinine amidohydrolase
MPRWEFCTSAEIEQIVRAGMDMAVLPIGATEQHGPHLATGTDTISAQWVAERAAERTGVLVLPAVSYGCSLGHTDHWPGTLSLGPLTLTYLVLDIARWAVRSGIRRFLMFSGHATNAPALGSAVLQLRYELPNVRFRQCGIWEISPRVTDLYCRDGRDVHANRAETSLLLHAAPDMVRPELAFDVPDVTVSRFWSYDMPRTTRTGVVGRPTESTPEDGASMAAIVVEEFEGPVRKALAEDWPEVPPGPPHQDPA